MRRAMPAAPWTNCTPGPKAVRNSSSTSGKCVQASTTTSIASPPAAVVVDASLRIVLVSPLVKQLLGFDLPLGELAPHAPALALRGEDISDFPINNKSFDLSYCGNDL